MKSLTILKNGSGFEELKGCKTKKIQRKVIFSNTCAFDSLTSIIMVRTHNIIIIIFRIIDYYSFLTYIIFYINRCII